MLFDPDFVPLLSPGKTLCGVTLHMLTLVCIAREVCFFFLGECM
ncbi:unnamed protein product [Staurois parvus]|uniref:Uncharacterized protein n=1 Tax=Staurois parvus TaxID=386267 RepID=A0ABN9GJK2_9NEOB|nr:unnamed protein product [Staurois parvus]